MKQTTLDTHEQINHLIEESDFSGVVLAANEETSILQKASGFANRADMRPNQVNTRFGIASGCKIFTAIGICKLMEEGRLSFDTTLSSILQYDFPLFDSSITVHQLLTHTSGVPDYFDEETMDDFADLWKERPMYLVEDLKDFLPMFQNASMKFKPGERFHYNNAGYILLGLIIEEVTGRTFRDYIMEELFGKVEMKDSGYFFMDRLPINTAFGYISEDRTNIYSLPIVGGSDGGAYITAKDMAKFWKALMNHELLSAELTKRLLTPHVEVEEGEYYGYGVWISKQDDSIYKYHVMGYDPGVSFHSGFYPQSGLTLVVVSNKSEGAYAITKKVEELICDEA
ncbi:serine hydrolase domain-containing protein [Chungangia koreensis]|uniref:Serine hydrolase domain-containing protein n=1 Tax=Chungangia koreensis TaxID=752657 RepID=A0ABV8X5S2_9LACT